MQFVSICTYQRAREMHHENRTASSAGYVAQHIERRDAASPKENPVAINGCASAERHLKHAITWLARRTAEFPLPRAT
jgi:hypothetical protein